MISTNSMSVMPSKSLRRMELVEPIEVIELNQVIECIELIKLSEPIKMSSIRRSELLARVISCKDLVCLCHPLRRAAEFASSAEAIWRAGQLAPSAETQANDQRIHTQCAANSEYHYDYQQTTENRLTTVYHLQLNPEYRVILNVC
jgi:hypothetical protein